MNKIIKFGDNIYKGFTYDDYNNKKILEESLRLKQEEKTHNKRLVTLGQRKPDVIDKLNLDILKLINELNKYKNMDTKSITR